MQSLGNRPNEADELTDIDIEQLFHEGSLDVHNLEALINLPQNGVINKLKSMRIVMSLVHKKERATKTRTGQDIRNV